MVYLTSSSFRILTFQLWMKAQDLLFAGKPSSLFPWHQPRAESSREGSAAEHGEEWCVFQSGHRALPASVLQGGWLYATLLKIAKALLFLQPFLDFSEDGAIRHLCYTCSSIFPSDLIFLAQHLQPNETSLPSLYAA